MSVVEAERLTGEIKLKLDDLADTHDAVMPLIREAIEREAYRSLGYDSHTAYVSDRFGGSLARLGVEGRRDVVVELTRAKMSPPAIAKVVGVDETTVRRDLKATPAHARVDLPDKTIGVDGRERLRKVNRPDPELVAKRQADLEAKRIKEDERLAEKRALEAAEEEEMRLSVEARGGGLKKKVPPRVVSTQERLRTAVNDSIVAIMRALNDPGLNDPRFATELAAAEAGLAKDSGFRLDNQRKKLRGLIDELGKRLKGES